MISGEEWICSSTLSDTHTQTVRRVAWSYSDSKLTSVSFDGTTAIWERREGDYECSLTLEGHKDEVKCAAWSPSGLYLGKSLSMSTLSSLEFIGAKLFWLHCVIIVQS